MKNTLRYWRKKRRYTQTELATMIGVQAQTIGNIENDKSEPRPKIQRSLASVLQVPLEELFPDEEEQPVFSVA